MHRTICVLLTSLLVTTVSARKNEFMIPGTDSYNKTTAKLIGTWNVDSYQKGDDGEQIGTTYISGTLEIKKQAKAKKPGEAVFTFLISPEAVKGRIEAWNGRKKDDLEVTEYKIIATCEWKVSSSGEILHLDEPVMTCEIEGSGKQLKNFRGFENGFLQSASEMKNEGGLNNLIGGMVMSKASGTDSFTPSIPDQTNFEFTDTTMKFKNIFKKAFTFTRK